MAEMPCRVEFGFEDARRIASNGRYWAKRRAKDQCELWLPTHCRRCRAVPSVRPSPPAQRLAHAERCVGSQGVVQGYPLQTRRPANPFSRAGRRSMTGAFGIGLHPILFDPVPTRVCNAEGRGRRRGKTGIGVSRSLKSNA